ncbi:MAG TPA: zinc ribbon domain-containing protein [Solirubrobacteraceae bacterium]|nr:zinc ribbon domain-containing protein [Solirubrobacteraceae bacterium]
MPIYEYRCKKGHTFDVRQSFSDDPVTACEVCGAPVERVYHPVAVHFKGSGFYNTDYGTKKRAREMKDAKDSSSTTSASESSSSSDSGSSGSSDKSSTSSTAGGDSKPAKPDSTKPSSSSTKSK